VQTGGHAAAMRALPRRLRIAQRQVEFVRSFAHFKSDDILAVKSQDRRQQLQFAFCEFHGITSIGSGMSNTLGCVTPKYSKFKRNVVTQKYRKSQK